MSGNKSVASSNHNLGITELIHPASMSLTSVSGECECGQTGNAGAPQL